MSRYKRILSRKLHPVDFSTIQTQAILLINNKNYIKRKRKPIKKKTNRKRKRKASIPGLILIRSFIKISNGVHNTEQTPIADKKILLNM